MLHRRLPTFVAALALAPLSGCALDTADTDTFHFGAADMEALATGDFTGTLTRPAKKATGVDQWGFFQAKSTKQALAEMAAEELSLQRDTIPGLTADARTLYDRKIAEHLAKAKQYEAEKAKIKEDAEAAAKEYDRLNVHDDQFDMAEASLSVAIALFGVTALTQKRWLLAFGIVIASFGTVLGFAGFLGKNLHPDWLAKLLS